MTRREWLSMASACAVAPFVDLTGRERRIQEIVVAYSNQGVHRTGTAVDRASANWLSNEVRAAGLRPSLESFALQRIDPVAASLVARGRRIDGLPLFDGGFTGENGLRGALGGLDSDAPIGVTETVPNAAGAGALGEARRKNRHAAIVCLTRGGRPGLCPSNAEAFLQPFGPPVLQISSEHADWLQECARAGAEAHLVAHATRNATEAFNVTASLTGADRALPPLVVMTPRSGWYSCASERGGGLVCWLELMRILRDSKPARDVLFVASSGHELGHLGINAFVDRRPGVVPKSVGWIHLGANIGASIGAGNTVQASDEQMENRLADALTAAGARVDARVPRGRVPGGEAEVVHRGGGRYVSLIGRNTMFHHPDDRGPDVVDVRAIAACADAFASVAKTLAA